MNKSNGPEHVPALLPAKPSPLLAGGAILLFVLGLFCAWQSWAMWGERNGAAQIERVNREQAERLAKFVADTRARVIAAASSDAVTGAFSTDDANHNVAKQAFKHALPDTLTVEFYQADVQDVVGGDFSKFGYAKAAMLIDAHREQHAGLLQSRLVGQQRVLALALPVQHGAQTLAYAYVELPYAPLQQVFQQQSVPDVRMDLRQGDGHGDLLIDSIGSTGTGDTLADVGTPVPDSLFRIGARPKEFAIFLPDSLWFGMLLAVLFLGAGVVMLWLRKVGLDAVRERIAQRKAPRAPAPAPKPAAAAAPVVKKPAVAEKPKPQEAPAPGAAIAVDRSIFRAYDIRGVVGKTLTPQVAREIGRAIGSEAQHRGLKEIAVGRDGRLSGPDLAGALIEGLRAAGCDVIDIGAAPTPVLYFATYHLNIGSGVSVTGSHNPPDYNGFKIVLGGDTLSEGAIQDLYARISEGRYTSGNGGLQRMDVSRDYIGRITDDVMIERKLKVVVDCGNGIPGAVAPQVLEGIGCEVLPLYCDVDGTFPNHHPDPSDPHNLKDLILSVQQTNADLGIAFDGDGDRLGVVTAHGEVIFPDRLLMLFAKDVLTRNPGATIIYDVKCTGKLQPWILQAGGSPIMWRTGHSLIKAKMRETDAELAGEMSGHFFFRERWYGFDDGIYAAARLMEILAADPEGRAAEEILSSLPKGVSTPELKITMREGEHYRFIEKFQQTAQFDGARVTTIDGVRADWPDGWGLVRASNTTPILVLRFDADSDEALRRIQDVFRQQLLAVDKNLKLPF